MNKVRIAVQIRPQHCDYADMARALDQAETLGIDIAYTWDHFFPLAVVQSTRHRQFGPSEGKHYEAWTLLAAFAERSKRILLGTLVTANSYRNPQLLADMARTIDHISSGRAILGIGSGWNQRDYEEYGYEYGTAGSRLRDLDAAMPLIKKRISLLDPQPIGSLPILIGGGGEKVTLRIVAEYADIWHSFGTPDIARHKNDILDDWCDKVDRNPEEIERAVGVQKQPTDGAAATGDEYHDIGIRQFTIDLDGPDFNFDGIDDWLSWRDRKNAPS